jgi:hypothetical protein
MSSPKRCKHPGAAAPLENQMVGTTRCRGSDSRGEAALVFHGAALSCHRGFGTAASLPFSTESLLECDGTTPLSLHRDMSRRKTFCHSYECQSKSPLRAAQGGWASRPPFWNDMGGTPTLLESAAAPWSRGARPPVRLWSFDFYSSWLGCTSTRPRGLIRKISRPQAGG